VSHSWEVVEFLNGRSDLLPFKAGHNATWNCDRYGKLDLRITAVSLANPVKNFKNNQLMHRCNDLGSGTLHVPLST